MFNFTKHQLIAACVVVVVALVGMVALTIKSGVLSPGTPVTVTQPATSAAPDAPQQTAPQANPPAYQANAPAGIFVHVVGEVRSPGVYQLAKGSRAEDAVNAAGGPTESADMASINLARLLVDGEQIHVSAKGQVPAREECRVSGKGKAVVSPVSNPQASVVTPSSTPSEESASKGSKKKSSALGNGTVNINTADLNELQKLPGVGPSMAQRILDYRSTNGPFKSVDELAEVKGIGPKKLEKMRAYVSL